MAKATIPNIHCDCGRTIQGWRYAKKGLTLVICRCGIRWRLIKAGKPIIIRRVMESDLHSAQREVQ